MQQRSKDTLLVILILSIFTLAGFFGGLIVSSVLKPLTAEQHVKPYSIIYEHPTQRDYEVCATDENCMDVIALDHMAELELDRREGRQP